MDPWRQLILFILIGLVSFLVGVFYFSITSNDVVVGFLSDDAIYLLMAETYSPWQKDTFPVLEFLRFEFQFPPLYPVLLGVMGVDANNPELASMITVSFLLITLVIFGIWVWLETQRWFLAILFPIILALLPSTILLSQELWSEFLFMCFLYAAFACLESKEMSDRHWLSAALLIGLASITRSIGIATITAFGLLLMIKRPRQSFLLIIISILPLLFWMIFRYIIAVEHVYWEIIASQFADKSIGQLSEFIISQLTIMAESWYWLFSVIDNIESSRIYGVLVSGVLFIFSLFGFFTRLKQRKFDALCIPFYLSVILVWPYTGVHFVSRFLFPVLPLFIFYIWIGANTIFKTPAKSNLGFGVCLLLMSVTAYPATSQFISRSYLTVDTELMPYRRSRAWLLASTNDQALREAVYARELFQVLKMVADDVPDDECILTFQTPIVMLHTRRIAGALPSPDVSDEDFKHNTKACRFILAMFMEDSVGVYPSYYPLERIYGKKEYKVTPFFPRQQGYNEPVAFLIERIEYK